MTVPSTKRKSKNLSKADAVRELWNRANLRYLLKGKQTELYDDFKNSKEKVSVVCSGRRFGKCQPANSEIMTTTGLKKIIDIKVGDLVYGVDDNGVVKETPVIATHSNGIREVVDLTHKGKVFGACTLDHRWLVVNTNTRKQSVKAVKDFQPADEIVRKMTHNKSIHVKIENKREEETYDISIGTKNHLYLTGSGLVTHNSTVLCVLAIEKCLEKPGAIIKYAAPSQRMVTEILEVVMRPILEDCPLHLAPEWKEAKKRFMFPNGSQIQIAATESGHIEKLRGGQSDLAFVDEAGFASNLGYVIGNILVPATATTGGKIILCSTPNYEDPQHPFNVDYLLPREEQGTLKKFTIYDSPMLDAQAIEDTIEAYGGVDNLRFRCEFLCEIVIDREKMVFPEFNPESQIEIVRDYKMPPFYDAYTSMDIGFKDLTAVLFSYYDYVRQTTVIVDELVLNGPALTTDNLSSEIKRIEELRFKDSYGFTKEPTKRIADNNSGILLNDLHKLHGIFFLPTAKDNKHAQINEVKLRMRNNQIEIHPRCENLIYHLKCAKWDKSHKGFQRIRENKILNLPASHADCADALIYLIRNILTTKDPYPSNYFGLSGSNVHKGKEEDSSVAKFMKSLMGITNKNSK